MEYAVLVDQLRVDCLYLFCIFLAISDEDRTDGNDSVSVMRDRRLFSFLHTARRHCC